MRHHTPTEQQPPSVRFVWMVSFVATLSLIAILAVAKSAQALPVPTTAPPVTAALTNPHPPVAEPEPEEFEEEEFEEECGEEEDESECEEAEAGVEAPSECVLSSAEATVSTLGHDRVRLVIHYTAASPTAVAVAFGLHGSKGSLYLGESKKRFASKGVFRQTESLSDAQMTKATGARDFAVQLYAVHAPHYCRHFFDRHLTVRQTMPSGLMWTDPEALPRSRRPV